MKKVKLKVKILASIALVSMTIAGGTYYATNAKQHRNLSENNIELNVEKQDKDTIKIYLSNFSDLAKSLQLSVKIDKGNVKFEEDSIRWLVNSESNDAALGNAEYTENKSAQIQTDYKIDKSGKTLDLFVVSKEAINSDGGRIELCEIDVSKDESIIGKILKSNDGTYTVVPNVVDGEAYSYVTYSTNKRIGGENIVNPSDSKLSINDEPVIRFKDNSSILDNQIIISKGSIFNINDYVEAFDADGNEINNIEYTGKVDNKKVGSYNIVCSATDSSGIKSTLEVTVIVEEITSENISKPVIYGTEEPAEIFIGEEFDLERGITAKDYMGRNLKLTISGDYDINTAGVYTIIYSATDRFNNTVTAERVLIVRDKNEEDFIPEIPDNSGDNDYTIPEIIESIIDKEVVTPISGVGTSSSPLLVEVNEVSSEKFVMFLNSIDQFEIKEGKVKEDDTYKTLTLKLAKKTSNSRTIMIINSNSMDDYYMSIRVDKSRGELLNVLNNYIEQKNFVSNNDNNNGNSNNNSNSNNSSQGSSNGNNNSGTSEESSSNGNSSSSDISTDDNVPSQGGNNTNTEEESSGNSSGGSFVDNVLSGIANIFNGSNNSSQENSNISSYDETNDSMSNNSDSNETETDKEYEKDIENIDNENSVDEDVEDTKAHKGVLNLEHSTEKDSKNNKKGLLAIAGIAIISISAICSFYYKNKNNKK